MKEVYYHSGIEWPIVNERIKKTSSSVTNKSVWIQALRKGLIDPYEGADNQQRKTVERAKQLVKSMEKQSQKDWRHGYIDFLYEFSCIMAMSSTEEALNIASCGLNALNSNMIIKKKSTSSGMMDINTDEGYDIVSAKDAVLIDGTVPLEPMETYTVVSSSEKESNHLNGDMPYYMACPRDPKVKLTGSSMIAQLQAWVDYGCIESSAQKRATTIAKMKSTSELNLDNKIFCLLGATSALGPAQVLLENIMGSTVMAVARPGKKLQSLINLVKKSTPGTTMYVPQCQSSNSPGADLIQNAPELARWIVETANSQHPEKQLVILNLAYLDGEKNVRAGVAMDLITEYVCQQKKNTAVGYILSPSTVHAISNEAAIDAKRRYDTSPFWHTAFRHLSISSQLTPANTWSSSSESYKLNLPILNGLVGQQGPNYALTKSSQQWRSMVLAYKGGHVVSANFGPPCRTENMTSHANIAAAIEGMQYIQPHVTFDPNVARTIMAALLFYDISVQPRKADLQVHPMEFFVQGSVNGGAWRSPYKGDTIGALSFLMGKLKGSWTPEESLADSSHSDENKDDMV